MCHERELFGITDMSRIPARLLGKHMACTGHAEIPDATNQQIDNYQVEQAPEDSQSDSRGVPFVHINTCSAKTVEDLALRADCANEPVTGARSA
jgi:hypothetical protein